MWSHRTWNEHISASIRSLLMWGPSCTLNTIYIMVMSQSSPLLASSRFCAVPTWIWLEVCGSFPHPPLLFFFFPRNYVEQNWLVFKVIKWAASRKSDVILGVCYIFFYFPWKMHPSKAGVSPFNVPQFFTPTLPFWGGRGGLYLAPFLSCTHYFREKNP